MLAVRENQQGLGRGNTLEPNGKDEQVSTRWGNKGSSDHLHVDVHSFEF